MLSTIRSLAALLVLALPLAARAQSDAPRQSPCVIDSEYQRLAFWIGDWTILDTAGAFYARQQVKPVVDGCALEVQWTGRSGDKGIGVTVYDAKSRTWKQIYASNQTPYASSVKYRSSDPSYRGPGVRFLPVLSPADDTRLLTRITIMPLSDRKVLQQFEDSSDGGTTWQVQFRAIHQPRS
jgi:hypothetical protein